jgi:anti-sigma B factor antagonist
MTSPNDDLRISVEPLADEGYRLVVVGEVDAASAAELQTRFLELVESAPENSRVEADLSGVSFMDSTGLRVLIVAQQAITAKGGRVELHAASASVRRLLEITGLLNEYLPGEADGVVD